MDLELYKTLRNYILNLMKIKRASLSPKDLSQLLKELRQLR
ncbi:hypothetical protein AB0X64_05085 [Limosilactobacillus vaginalis]